MTAETVRRSMLRTNPSWFHGTARRLYWPAKCIKSGCCRARRNSSCCRAQDLKMREAADVPGATPPLIALISSLAR